MHIFSLSPCQAYLTYKHKLRDEKHFNHISIAPISAYFEARAYVSFQVFKNAFSRLSIQRFALMSCSYGGKQKALGVAIVTTTHA